MSSASFALTSAEETLGPGLEEPTVPATGRLVVVLLTRAAEVGFEAAFDGLGDLTWGFIIPTFFRGAR